MATAYPRSTGHSRPDRLPIRNEEATSQPPRRDLRTIYDKLLAMRLDLVHGVMPRAERITLTAGDLESLLGQLDAAIAATRAIAGAETTDWPREPGIRQDTTAMT
jgi:hypothetical protein